MSGRIKIRKKTVIINSISSLLTLVINLSVLVWLQQYLLKRISTDEYAILPVLLSIMGFVPLINIILTSGISRYITIAFAKGDDDEVTRIVSSMFPVLVCASIAFLLIGGLIAWKLDLLFRFDKGLLHEAQIMLSMLMIVAALQIPASAFNSGFTVTQRFVLRDLINLGCQLLNYALLFCLLFGVSTRVLWVVTASSIGQIANLAISLPVSIKLLPAQRVRLNLISWKHAREIATFGGWNFFSKLSYVVKDGFDPLILTKYATSIDVAIFNIGNIPYRQILRFLTPLLMPIMPVLGALEADGQIVRIKNITYRYSKYCLWVALLVALPFLVYPNRIIDLYIGPKFKDAAIIIVMIIGSMFFQLFTVLCPAVANARGLVKGLALRDLAFAVLNIFLTIIFVPVMKMGAVGSALATLISTIIIFSFFIVPYNLNIIEGKFNEFTKAVLIPGLLPLLISIAALFILNKFIFIQSWIELLLYTTFGCTIYCLVLITTCLNEKDKEEIRSIVGPFLMLFRGNDNA